MLKGLEKPSSALWVLVFAILIQLVSFVIQKSTLLGAIKLTKRAQTSELILSWVRSSSKVPVPSINIFKLTEKGIHHLELWWFRQLQGPFDMVDSRPISTDHYATQLRLIPVSSLMCDLARQPAGTGYVAIRIGGIFGIKNT